MTKIENPPELNEEDDEILASIWDEIGEEENSSASSNR